MGRDAIPVMFIQRIICAKTALTVMMTLVSLPEIYWPQLALSWYRIFERTRCGGGDLREGSSPHKKSSNECSGKLTGKIEKVFKQLSDLGGERPGGGGGLRKTESGR